MNDAESNRQAVRNRLLYLAKDEVVAISVVGGCSAVTTLVTQCAFDNEEPRYEVASFPWYSFVAGELHDGELTAFWRECADEVWEDLANAFGGMYFLLMDRPSGLLRRVNNYEIVGEEGRLELVQPFAPAFTHVWSAMLGAMLQLHTVRYHSNARLPGRLHGLIQYGLRERVSYATLPEWMCPKND